ncbi:hypothetical protein AAGG74_15940 [Bacillus mexicanus]|uniref:hypothetical protein n=1 Tax=Bacillus mexicanus TaxID=2834415 RepID=UPI003D2147C7
MRQIPHAIFYSSFSVKERDEYLEYIEKKIKRDKKKRPLFFKMYEIVKEFVKADKEDFYLHDYNRLTIETEGSRKFIWVVKDTGTYMISLDNNFLDGMEEEFMLFKNIRKQSYFGKKTWRIFVVNLDNNSLKQIDFNDVHKDMFSNKYGSITEYFEKRTKGMNNERYLKTKYLFQLLMEKYRNHVPKRMVDSLISNPPKRVFEFYVDTGSQRSFI